MYLEKNRGNGGAVGTANVSGAFKEGLCSPRFFVGSGDNQMLGNAETPIFKNMFVFPLFPIPSIRGYGYRLRFF